MFYFMKFGSTRTLEAGCGYLKFSKRRRGGPTHCPFGHADSPLFVGRCQAAARRGYEWAGVAVGGRERGGEGGGGPAYEGPMGGWRRGSLVGLPDVALGIDVLVVVPAAGRVRATPPTTLLRAPGTSGGSLLHAP